MCLHVVQWEKKSTANWKAEIFPEILLVEGLINEVNF
jgi:hypothetical protein